MRIDDVLDIDSLRADFEWDNRKEQINFQKHGICFKTAMKVFQDPNGLVYEDLDHTSEMRYVVIGQVEKILFVVCTVRCQNTIRLISARLATKKEKEQYYDNAHVF